MPTVTVTFYRGRTLPALLVRWWSRRRGQAFSDVPSHCALILGGKLFEFVASGYSVRDAAPADSAWTGTVCVPSIEALGSAVIGCLHERYDWAAIALDFAERLLPPSIKVPHFAYSHKYDCSRAVYGWLRAGGWDAPGWIRQLAVPLSPNDLLKALVETCSCLP